MSNPAATAEDPADTLAKEIIARFCTAANKFIQPRVTLPHTQNPLAGFRLPFKPLAEKIRDLARQMSGPVAPPDASNDWFEEEPGSPVAEKAAEPQSTQDDGLTAEKVLAALEGRKMRLNALAGVLGVTNEEMAQFIAASDRLTVNGPGWVQATA